MSICIYSKDKRVTGGALIIFIEVCTDDYLSRTSNWMIPLGTEIVSGNYRYLPLQDLIFLFVSQRGRSSTVLEKAVLVKRF